MAPPATPVTDTHLICWLSVFSTGTTFEPVVLVAAKDVTIGCPSVSRAAALYGECEWYDDIPDTGIVCLSFKEGWVNPWLVVIVRYDGSLYYDVNARRSYRLGVLVKCSD